jgi:hypothetical protein
MSTAPTARVKTGRNETCPCGSGKKYKKCCLGKADREQALETQGPRQEHKATMLVTPDGYEVPIDDEIVPLIRGMWRREWQTFQSCQDNILNRVWIEMDHASAEEFLTLVACQFKDKQLRSRITDPMPLNHQGIESDDWLISANGTDFNEIIEDGEAKSLGIPDVMITISIRFPRHQLADVTKIVCEASV